MKAFTQTTLAVLTANILFAMCCYGGFLAWRHHKENSSEAKQERAERDAAYIAHSNNLVLQLETSRRALVETEAMIQTLDAEQARQRADKEASRKQWLEDNAKALREAR